MAKGNLAKQGTINFWCRNQSVTQPAQLYLALFATDPTDAGTGTEASYSGYSRPAVTFGAPTLSGGLASSSNTNRIEFPVVPAASGNAAYVALMTAATGGTVVYYGPLAATYPLGIGVQPIVPIGSLTVTEK